MITRLLPSQIGQFWDIIKGGVIELGVRAYPGNWEIANNVFQKCLAGLVQAWLCYDTEGDHLVLKAFYLTTIEKDSTSGSRVMALVLVYIHKTPSEELVKEAVEAMHKFAASCNCADITLQTPVGHREKFIKEAFGEGKKQTIYTFPVRA